MGKKWEGKQKDRRRVHQTQGKHEMILKLKEEKEPWISVSIPVSRKKVEHTILKQKNR